MELFLRFLLPAPCRAQVTQAPRCIPPLPTPPFHLRSCPAISPGRLSLALHYSPKAAGLTGLEKCGCPIRLLPERLSGRQREGREKPAGTPGELRSPRKW